MLMKRISSLSCAVSAVSLSLSLVACNEDRPVESAKPVEQVKVTPEAASSDDAEPSNAVFKAKARKVVGEANIQRKQDWKPLRHGQNVFEGNHVKTGSESEVLLAANDGSTITVSEKSEVEISAEIIDSVRHHVTVFVNNGNVQFDIQKQKERVLDFKTGTATASIRGTAGFVGSVNGTMVASLKEGKVDVTAEDGSVTGMAENQTVIVAKSGKAKKLNLKSSGTKALASALDSMAVAYGTEQNIDEAVLQKTLQTFDKDYSARKASFEKSVNFMGDALDATIYTPSITLTASGVTPGIQVTVLGETVTVGADGKYQKTFEWDATSFGPKRFLVSCSDGVVEIPCFMWTTVYADPATKPVVEEPAVEEVSAPAAESASAKKAEAKRVNLKVSIAGPAVEKKHLPVGARTKRQDKIFNTKLKIKLSGITESDLSSVKSIMVSLNDKVVKTFDNVNSLNIDVPVSVELNNIADYEVVVNLKNGKVQKAKKRYEVFCDQRLHDSSDPTKYRDKSMTVEKEYERVSGKLKRK